MTEFAGTERTGNRSGGSSGCPYALALQDDEQSKDESHASAGAIRNCPAFSSSCPFKDTTSPEDIRKKLLELPASHLDREGHQFYQVLEELHAKIGNESAPLFPNLGGCPVAQSPALKHQFRNFRDAMEDLSLTAIMARLAKQNEIDNSEGEEPSEGSDTMEAPAVSPPPPVPLKSQVSSDSVPNRRLSSSLKIGTAVAHQEAEDVHFVRNFIRGQIDADVYRQMVADLYFVYEALEIALDAQAPKHFPTLHHPELARTGPLLQDCDYWLGTRDMKTVQPSPATRDYCDRIRNLARQDPLLLLAHSYTRYLGDLSGGKVLARVARRALSLPKGVGLAFYEFSSITSMKLFKDSYRKALDELNLTESQVEAIVQEANVAFLLNVRLFEELDLQAGVPGASVRPLEDALNPREGSNPAEDDPSAAECPFLKRNPAGATEGAPTARCPWPFVVFHDKRQFLTDWQTYAFVILTAGLLLSVCKQQAMGQLGQPMLWALGLALFVSSQVFGAGKPSTHNDKAAAKSSEKSGGQCPWPFVLLHDPRHGMQDWKSWATLGVVACGLWSKAVASP